MRKQEEGKRKDQIGMRGKRAASGSVLQTADLHLRLHALARARTARPRREGV